MDLKTLYPKLSASEKRVLAAKCGITVVYLGHIATGWTRVRNGRTVRARPSVELIGKLCRADRRLTLRALLSEASAPSVSDQDEAV